MPKHLSAFALTLSLGLAGLAGCNMDHGNGSTPDQPSNGTMNSNTGTVNNGSATTPGTGDHGGTSGGASSGGSSGTK